MPRSIKTLEYRFANWLLDEQNLEKLLRQAWNEFPTQLQRAVCLRGNKYIMGLRCNDFENNGFAIHCARFTDGQSIGTIPMAAKATALVGERAPEDSENFLNSDFMALIKDNHLIVMNAGRNAGSLRSFLTGLFKEADFGDSAQQLDLARVGDLDKLAMIQAVGVKSIDMGIEISETIGVELDTMQDDGGIWDKIKSSAANAFHSITAHDETISQLNLAEQGRVNVSIDVKKADLEIAKTGLNELAQAIAEDEEAENFTIVLRNSQTIRADEVSVKKQVRLDEVANSVSVGQAWDEMAKYYSELSDLGQIGT